jgi:hypothetical protein
MYCAITTIKAQLTQMPSGSGDVSGFRIHSFLRL